MAGKKSNSAVDNNQQGDLGGFIPRSLRALGLLLRVFFLRFHKSRSSFSNDKNRLSLDLPNSRGLVNAKRRRSGRGRAEVGNHGTITSFQFVNFHLSSSDKIFIPSLEPSNGSNLRELLKVDVWHFAILARQ